MVQRSDCARPSHRAHDAAAFARRILGHKSAVVCAHCLRSTAQIAFDHSYVLCVGVDEWVVGVSITDRICGNGISERQRENASLTVLFNVAFVQVRCLQCWVEMYEVRSPLRPRLVVVGHFCMGANIDEHLLYAVAIIDERPNLDVAAHSDWGVGSVLVQKNVWHIKWLMV